MDRYSIRRQYHDFRFSTVPFYTYFEISLTMNIHEMNELDSLEISSS